MNDGSKILKNIIILKDFIRYKYCLNILKIKININQVAGMLKQSWKPSSYW